LSQPPQAQIGSQVLEKLLDSGKSVRIIVRGESRIPEQTRERIEIVEGSHGDLEVVNKAFQGADSVFWLVPPDPRATDVNAAYVGFTRPACEAIKAQGVKHVVGVSTLGREVRGCDGWCL
jgi:uncharacterized protein YbjT (DUF2867 family)